MVAPVNFHVLNTDIVAGAHASALNDSSDVLKVALLNVEPIASSQTSFADVSANQPSGTGYTNGGTDVENVAATVSGVISVDGSSIKWTAGADDWTQFRYVTLYNETASNRPLMMYWDFGASVSLTTGDTFTFNITSNIFSIS